MGATLHGLCIEIAKDKRILFQKYVLRSKYINEYMMRFNFDCILQK